MRVCAGHDDGIAALDGIVAVHDGVAAAYVIVLVGLDSVAAHDGITAAANRIATAREGVAAVTY